MSGQNQELQSIWSPLEEEVRQTFRSWARYRLHTFAEISRYADGRAVRLDQLADAASDAEHLANAWSSSLDASSSIARAHFLSGILRTGESLKHFADRVLHAMKEECYIFNCFVDVSDLADNARRRGLPDGPYHLFSIYEEKLPVYGIPSNIELMVESLLYALYVAWSPNSKIVLPDNRKELLRALTIEEDAVRVVTPRRFEELVAYVYERLGCRAELTKATRDWGGDVLAWQPGPFGTESLIVIQTKLYAGEKKIDLAGVHALHGAVTHYNATHGHLVATSDLTGPAQQFMNQAGYKFINLSVLREEVRRILYEE